MSSATPPASAIFPAIATLLADFARFAGRKGVLAGVAVALGAVLEGAGLVLIIPILGIVFGSAATTGRIGVLAGGVFHALALNTPFERLAFLLGVFAVIMVVRALIISFRNVTLMDLQISFIESLRARIAERLAGAEWTQLIGLRHARITHLMSGDIQRVAVATSFLLQLSVAAVLLITQCALAFYLSPALAAIAFVLLVVGAFGLIPVMRRARRLGEYQTSANLGLLNMTAQFLGGLKLAISQNLQSAFVQEFRSTLHDLKDQQLATTRQIVNNRLAMSTLSALVGACLVLVGVGVFHVAAPVLMTLLLIVGRMNGPATQIQQGAQQIATALPAYETFKSLERELAVTESSERSSDGSASIPEGRIVLDRVTFLHADEGKPDSLGGVQDVSLAIGPGEFIGMVGASGAGKTTLADLLVGLLTPQQGHIAVGGALLETRALPAWRNSIAYVSQDPFLFHDTIRRNLAWASPGCSESDMWTALALGDADELVRRMSQGLDTPVGERGTLVSGGERQRIALARALLRRPRLLILDEATNAIDVPGERAILNRLAALDPRPAIVMIAHRPESLALCSRILRMENGRLVGDTGASNNAGQARLQVPQKV